MMINIQRIWEKAISFENEAHNIFETVEDSKSRVVSLRKSYYSVQELTIEQQHLMFEALKCIDVELYRAAHVMAWSALADFLQKLDEGNNYSHIKSARPKWKITTVADVRDGIPDSQLIDALREAGFLRKSESKALHGLLNKRNECAHPTTYVPNMNEALGYVNEVLNRLDQLRRHL